MTNPQLPPAPAAPAGRLVHDRRVEETAPLRCLCYAAYSELTASPHDTDPRPGLAARIGLGTAVPHAPDLDGLLAEVAGADLDRLRAEYSGLFEVGSHGPPAPIREDLQTGQQGGTREEIVRFYDFFGYVLTDKFAWAPDHLSVELEFMHFLCFREAEGVDDVVSFQLAQADFSERHLVRWLPQFRKNVERVAAGSLYARVIASLHDFATADLEWQRSTIGHAGTAAQPGAGGRPA